MAKALDPEIKKIVLDFLVKNRDLNNKKCSQALKAAGVQISERTVYDYRIAYDLPYDKPKTALIAIKELSDAGHAITPKLLQEKMGISRKYSYNLVVEWLNIGKAKGPEIKLQKNQRLTPHGILTVKGAVTRHELR